MTKSATGIRWGRSGVGHPSAQDEEAAVSVRRSLPHPHERGEVAMRFSNGQEATREQPSFIIGTQDRNEGDPHVVADPFLPRSAKPVPVPVS